MILDDICAHKRGEVDAQMAKVSLDDLHEQMKGLAPPRDFRKALQDPGISLIAEVKFTSPVKGDLLGDVDPVDVAAAYEAAGARAVSVLTDEKYFKGHLNYLTHIHRDVAIPCLRKEFIIDEYQIYEARAAEADAILLIVRILSDRQIKDYIQLASELGMDALVETHDGPEIDRALEAGAHIIGINNRDLDTFKVDLATTTELRKHVPGGHTLVSESGIHSREDVAFLEDGGVDAVLIGEALVTSNNIERKVRELIGSHEG
jgi:indole-3-glycerol phosphate synthase